MTFLARELVPGDIIYLGVGDRVPADLRLFEVSLLFPTLPAAGRNEGRAMFHVYKLFLTTQFFLECRVERVIEKMSKQRYHFQNSD